MADSHGKRYQVDFVMQHQGKSVIVRTGWIIRTGEDVPRLTSCYVSVVIGPGCRKSRRRNTLWLRLWQSISVVLQKAGESMVHYARM